MRLFITLILLHVAVITGWSQSFSTISPKPEAISSDTLVFFNWNVLANASKYRLEVSSEPSFLSPIQIVTANLNYTVDLEYGSYYWRVIADTGNGFNCFSRVTHFIVFEPQENNNLTLWLQGSKGITYDANGTNISSWSGIPSNIIFTQSSLPKKPVIDTTSLNGHPVIKFDGVDDFLSGGDILDIGTKSRTIFLTARSNTNNGSFYAKSVAAGAPNRFALVHIAPNDLLHLYEDFSVRNITTIPGYGEFIIYTVTINRNAGTIKLYKNGVQIGSVPGIQGAGYNFNSTFRFLLGAYNNASDNGEILPLNGSIAEMIMVDEALSDSLRELNEEYLRQKYIPPVNLGYDTIIGYSLCQSVPLNAGPHFTAYQWSTGETTQSIMVDRPGTYSVTVTDVFGYTSVDTVEVRSEYFPSQKSDTTICQGSQFTWDTKLSHDAFTFLWSTGSTDSAIMILDAGAYYVTVTDTFGCPYVTDTAWVTLDSFDVRASLGADTTLCLGDSIGLKTGASEAASYSWSTGSTDSRIAIPSPGQYSVTATSYAGCIGKDTIVVSSQGTTPAVNFTATDLCLGDSTHFLDQTTFFGGSFPTAYHWSFGDTDTSALPSPPHAYGFYGTYPVTLTVATNQGCVAKKTQNVGIGTRPNAAFGISTPICEDALITFTDQSSNIFGTITDYRYAFGTGDTIHQQHPTYTYTTPATYNASLITTTAYGCRDTAIKVVTVKEAPVASFATDAACTGGATHFTDLTTPPQGSAIIARNWNFGDNNSSSQQHPNHIYDTTGTYNVVLTVTAQNGCVSSYSDVLTIVSAPEANFSGNAICAGNPYTFIDMSQAPGSAIVSHQWNFGTGETSTATNPVITFQDTGNVLVKLVVENTEGCRDSLSKIVYISPGPKAAYDFTPGYGEAPLSVDFTNQSTHATDYTWLVDGVVKGTGMDFNYTFPENKTYLVRLLATTPNGCVDTFDKKVYVVKPLLDVTLDDLRTEFVPQPDGTYRVEATVRVINSGTREINDVRLEANIGGNTITETSERYLCPFGCSYFYTFSAGFTAIDPNAVQYLCVEARYPNGEPDEVPENNRLCEVLQPVLQVFNPKPNPAHNQVRLSFMTVETGEVVAAVYDANGRIIKELMHTNIEAGVQVFDMDVSAYQPGMYFLVVKFNGKISAKEFVVER